MRQIIKKFYHIFSIGRTMTADDSGKFPTRIADKEVFKAMQKSDLGEFQRRAYMGHFMAGPYALMLPELFDLSD